MMNLLVLFYSYFIRTENSDCIQYKSIEFMIIKISERY